MPGICGICELAETYELSSRLDGMLARMRHETWYATDRQVDGSSGIALGRISLGFVNAEPQPVVSRAGDLLAVMDGELYDVKALRASVSAVAALPAAASHAQILLCGFEAEGPDFFRRLNGRFTAAIWNSRQRKLVLVNDKFGSKPLYFAHAAGVLLFGSEIKTLLLDDRIATDPDVQGIAQFFTFGHLWGENTMYAAVRCLPAATCLTYDAEADTIAMERYWRLTPFPWSGTPANSDVLARVDELFKAAVDLRTVGTERLGMSLSGGLDARTMLGVMERGQQVDCVSLGMEGSLDRLTSETLARLAGCPYHGYVLDGAFLDNFETHLNRMVQLTDGHYLSQCIVMPTLPLYRDLGIEVLMRGHAGELMHMQKAYSFSLTPEALGLSGTSQIAQWLYPRLRAYMLEGVDEDLFTFADAGEVDRLARNSFDESLAETDGWDSSINRISHMFIGQRTRRETAMSLVKFGSVVETRMPYVDPDLVETLLSVPQPLRLEETIQSYILKKRRPEFLRPANSNTGAAVGASQLTRSLMYAKMRVMAKLGVRGYQPYERLGLWLRRELEPLVRSVLLSEQCLDRGVFRPGTVSRVVGQHFRSERNHTYLLMAMMIFELGQRTFADCRKAGVASRQ